MKDNSRANWPKGMEYKEQTTNPGWTSIYLWDEGHSYQGDIIGDTKEEAEYRAKQVLALPQMVRYFDEAVAILSTTNHNCTSRSDCQMCALLNDALSILKSIGEVE